MTASSNTMRLDSYKTRLWRERKINASDSIFTSKIFLNIATLLFIITDSVCLYTAFNCLMTENPVLLVVMVIAAAIVLDVPPAISGRRLKAYYQQLSDKKSAFASIGLSVLSVSFVMIFYFIMKVLTRDMVFDANSNASLINSVANTTQGITDSSSDKIVLFASLFQAVLPIGTSLASFLMAFISNPLGDRIYRLKKAKITAEANMIDLQVAMAEAEARDSYCEFLIAREKDNYNNFLDSTNCQSLTVKNVAALVVMEKVKSSEDITSITDYADELNKDNAISEEPENESLDYILEHDV